MKKIYTPVKPARSYEEQARRLTDIHGLEISDPERARRILSTVNYYRLTTYGKHLRRADDPDRFVPGVSLNTLYALYQFDMGLRHLLLPVLEFFEVQLRAKIAYQLAIRYGSLGYMEEENFRVLTLPNGTLMHKNLMGKFKSEVRRQRSLPFVRHHNTKYGGQFPIWAAVELFTFGMLASLYELMREDDQRAISRDYGIKPESLGRLIDASVNVRNICAHYNRLYNNPLETQPDLPPNLRAYESDRLFPLLLALRPVCGRERVYRQMVQGISQLAQDFPEADLSLCGFPEEWFHLLGGDLLGLDRKDSL